MHSETLFDLDSIPLISKEVAFRKDENGMLIFQIHTDEMYFVSNEVFQLISLCNGANTCSEIINQLGKIDPAFLLESGHDSVNSFFMNLMDRKIIKMI